MARLRGAAFNAVIKRDEDGKFAGMIRRLLGAGDRPDAPSMREVRTGGGSTISLSRARPGSGRARRMSNLASRATGSGSRGLDVNDIAKGLGSRQDFDHGSGNYLDDVQAKLDAGTPPRQIARDLDVSVRTLRDSTAIRYGGWPDLVKSDPEFRAERERLHAAGMAKADRLEKLAERLRNTRRPRATAGRSEARTSAAPGRPNNQDLLGRLSNFDNPPSRDEAHAMLQDRSKADLLEMARELSIPGARSMNKAQLRGQIVEATAGRRLDSIAIRGFRGVNPNAPDTPLGNVPAPRTPKSDEEIELDIRRAALNTGLRNTAARASTGSGRPRVPQAMTTAEVDNVLGRLSAANSRSEARAVVAGMNKSQLLDIARSLSIPRASSLNMAQLRQEIVEATTGRRLDSIAIRGFAGHRP